MKDDYINNMLLHDFLQELNSISRMAIIENAFVTEKMINIYSNILKYRWNEAGKKVTAAKEMNMLLKYCELFKLKHEALVDYTYIEKCDITTIFIPHYTVLPCIRDIFTMIRQMEEPFTLNIEVNQRQDEAWIQCVFTGNVDFKIVMERVSYISQQQDYGNFNEIAKKWQQTFKEDAFQIYVSEGKLEIDFICR